MKRHGSVLPCVGAQLAASIISLMTLSGTSPPSIKSFGKMDRRVLNRRWTPSGEGSTAFGSGTSLLLSRNVPEQISINNADTTIVVIVDMTNVVMGSESMSISVDASTNDISRSARGSSRFVSLPVRPAKNEHNVYLFREGQKTSPHCCQLYCRVDFGSRTVCAE